MHAVRFSLRSTDSLADGPASQPTLMASDPEMRRLSYPEVGIAAVQSQTEDTLSR